MRARFGAALAVLALAVRAQATEASCPKVAGIGVLVRCAQESSERVARVRGEFEVAQARRDVADRLLPSNPTVDVGVGRRQAQDGSSDLDRSVEATQTFEIGGQRGARISAAEADLRAARAFANAANSIVANEVLGAATHVVRARRALAMVRDQGDGAERLVQVSRARAEKGVGAPLETELAEAARVQALRDERAAAQELSEAEARLAEAVGADVQLAPDAGIPEPPAPVLSVAEMEDRALVLRPERGDEHVLCVRFRFRPGAA